MSNMVIVLQADEVRNKIAALKTKRDALNDEALVKSLPFGVSGAEKNSTGDAVTAIETLNADLDVVAKKLAVLINATGRYLTRVVDAFEAADSI